MILRREFLTAVPIAALLQAAPRVGGVKIGCQTNAWRIDPANFDTLLDVLRKLKELGYRGFENGSLGCTCMISTMANRFRLPRLMNGP